MSEATRTISKHLRLASFLLASVFWLLTPALGQTTLYLRGAPSLLGTVSSGGAGIGCNNGSRDYTWYRASTSSGTETSNSFPPTSSSPPCYHQDNTVFWRWISPPLSAAINLTGDYDYSVKCQESASQLNAGVDFVVYRWRRVLGGIDLLLDDSATTTECSTGGGTLTIAAHAPSCGASCSLAVGDRIVVIPRVQNVGNWGANGTRTFTLYYEGANTFAHFAQTVSFAADTNNARAVISP
jgi:hypothetical protein